MRPICVKCRRFYRVVRNGVVFLEGRPTSPDARPGNQDPDRWVPYKLWMGDKWECRGCGHELISGVGLSPLMEAHHEDFAEELRVRAPALQVNDC